MHIVAGPLEYEGIWLITLEPALGEQTERRLVGCLDDREVAGITGRCIGPRCEYR
ncbi:hypothetical protein ACWEO2_03520 [Nocardia sp. NPDC004278]